MIQIDGRQHRGNSKRVGEGTVHLSNTLIINKQGQQKQVLELIILVEMMMMMMMYNTFRLDC